MPLSTDKTAGSEVESSVSCPALFIAAPSSGQGKTTVTAAMARYFCRQGLQVRVFKTGPDYLDPQILEQASGHPVVQLDLWMAGLDWCRQQLFDAACEADLILVEGAMGLFDGEPSSADLAATFGLPVALLMDVKGMAQTAAAIATGLARYRPDIQVTGLIANNCGSERHAQLIRDALPAELPLLAVLARRDDVALPERHLGLVQASEVREELESRLERGADWLAAAGELSLPNPVIFSRPTAWPPQPLPRLLQGKTIAVARDAAFSFIYAANLECLQQLGARLVFFSPLEDRALPPADALWLPGGYPELHAAQLAGNTGMLTAIDQFFLTGKPILAECGGMLYCLETLTDLEGDTFMMLGLLDGHGAMRGKRGCQGMQMAVLPEGDIHGHSHHRSRTEQTPRALAWARRQRHPANGEAIYRERGLTASYLHLFFPSNPAAVAQLFTCPATAVVPSEESDHAH